MLVIVELGVKVVQNTSTILSSKWYKNVIYKLCVCVCVCVCVCSVSSSLFLNPRRQLTFSDVVY